MDEVKKIIEIAKKLMLRDGYHAPILCVKGTHGKVFTFLEHFGDTADERVKDMLNAGAMIASKRNVGELELIILVNEAWMGTNLSVLPSRDSNRVEALLIDVLDVRTQEEQLIAFKIIRNTQKKVIDLKQIHFPDKVETKGMLLPAFQQGYQIISPVKN